MKVDARLYKKKQTVGGPDESGVILSGTGVFLSSPLSSKLFI